MQAINPIPHANSGFCAGMGDSFPAAAATTSLAWCAGNAVTCAGSIGPFFPWVLLTVMTLNMKGDFVHCDPMSKGNQNRGSGELKQAREMVAAGLAKDVCDALQKLYDSTPGGPQRNKIKATQKAKRCRGH